MCFCFCLFVWILEYPRLTVSKVILDGKPAVVYIGLYNCIVTNSYNNDVVILKDKDKMDLVFSKSV